MGIPLIEGEIEIDLREVNEILLDELAEVIEEGLPDLMPEAEFLTSMSNTPQPALASSSVLDEKPSCQCCGRSDRKLWSGVCAWCCP